MSFTPYNFGSDAKFEKCLSCVLPEEGGYSNDAHDSGGMTYKGIIQREYDAHRRAWGLPTQWVRKMSDDEMRTIYHGDYWLPVCPQLPDGLNLEVFDLSVNGGPHRGVVELQIAMGMTGREVDGVFGPRTLARLSDWKDLPALIDDYRAARETFYRHLSAFKYFGKDWIGRSERIAAAAQKMV